MAEATEAPALTPAEVQSVLNPETNPTPTEFVIADRTIRIQPMKRRWQSIFFASAWPLVQAQLAVPEGILKSILDKTFMYESTVERVVKGEVEVDQHLDRAAAVIIASQQIGAEKDVQAAIASSVSFLLDNATTEQLKKLVDAQIAQERLAERVGEALPARFVALLNLAGVKGTTTDTVGQHLISSLAKLRDSIGDGK